MHPLYFGRADRRLYGVYHPPASEAPVPGASGDGDRGQRGSLEDASPPVVGHPLQAVVICPPIGQEYYHAHRALRTLAEELASRGLPALRFDYFGTGDSGGDPRDADLDGWERDVRTAAGEVRAAAAVGSVALVGLGLGGVLAARAADAAFLTRALVLWDPVVDGPRYLKKLKDSQERFLREYPGPPPRRPPRGFEMESRGFPLTTRLRRDLERIRMVGEEPPEVEAVLWVEGASEEPSLPDGAWSQPTVERLSLPEERGWREPGGHDTGLVPHRTVEAVARWLATGPETSEAP